MLLTVLAKPYQRVDNICEGTPIVRDVAFPHGVDQKYARAEVLRALDESPACRVVTVVVGTAVEGGRVLLGENLQAKDPLEVSVATEEGEHDANR